MPRRAAKKARRRRRPRRRRKRVLPPLAFPDSKLVRLKYADTITINPAVGAIAQHVFCANGLADPDVTVAGHQPRGFDQWMLVYDHYTVIGAKIRVQAVPLGDSGTSRSVNLMPGIFGVTLDDNTLLEDTTVQSVIESHQGRKYRYTGPLATHTAGRGPSITKRFSAKKFFKKSAIVGADLYRGDVASNPTETANFGLWYGSIAGSDPPSMVFMVEIEYIALLTERKHLAQS